MPLTSHHSSNTRNFTRNPSNTQRSSGATSPSNSTGKHQLTPRTSCHITSTSQRAQYQSNGWRAHRRISAIIYWTETSRMDMATKSLFSGMSVFPPILEKKMQSSYECVEKHFPRLIFLSCSFHPRAGTFLQAIS